MTVSRRLATSFLTLLVLTAILFCAGIFRVVQPWGHVFPGDGEVRLLGTDAYYHLRHAHFAMRNFPVVQRQDPWTHYPKGQRARSLGLFDLGLAALALPNPAALQTVAAWYPVGLGLAVFVALFVLIRTIAGTAAGLWACFILLLYPGNFLTRSMLGFADHHAAEVLLAVLTALGVVVCVMRASGDRPAPWWHPALGAAFPLAVFQFTWVGAPLHLAVVIGALYLTALAELWRTGSAAGIANSCSRYALGFLILVAPAGLLIPDLVMAPEAFALLLATGAGLAVGVAPMLRLMEWLAERWGRSRLVVIVTVIISVAVVTVLLQTSIIAAAVAALLKVKTAAVAEHEPAEWGQYFDYFGPPGCLVLLSPLLVPGIAQGPRRRAVLVVVLMTSMYGVLWIRTHDYDYLLGPFVAGLAAMVLIRGLSTVTASGWRLALVSVVMLILIAAIGPLRWSRLPWSPNAEIDRIVRFDDAWSEAADWMKHNTPAPSLRPGVAIQQDAEGDADYPADTYGVWVVWDHGNVVAALAERPVVWSQGVSAQIASWLLVKNEAESVRQLCRGCRGIERVRYVVLDATTMGSAYLTHVQVAGAPLSNYLAATQTVERENLRMRLFTFGRNYEDSVAGRLYLNNGSGLGHYRLVFASREQSLLLYSMRLTGNEARNLALRRRTVALGSPALQQRYEALIDSGQIIVNRQEKRVYYDGEILSTVKVFEQVRGVRLSGRARAGALVEASLRLESVSNGQSFNYVNQTKVKDDGRYELVLAHAAGPGAVDLGTDFVSRLPYVVRSVDSIDGMELASRELEIRADQIQEGAAVAFNLSGTRAAQPGNDID